MDGSSRGLSKEYVSSIFNSDDQRVTIIFDTFKDTKHATVTIPTMINFLDQPNLVRNTSTLTSGGKSTNIQYREDCIVKRDP